MQYLKPRKALNKAFLKVKPIRSEIEAFKSHLIRLLDHIKDSESEEFHKNLVADFLKNTAFAPDYFINTKGRNDLVIHNGKSSDSPAGVLIEAKNHSNRSEMVAHGKLNTKALQELLLYFLRERITHKNYKVKHLVVTNIYEWFLFDARIFENAFANNKKLVQAFRDFEAGRLSGNTTDFFYREIAAPAIAAANDELEYTWFDFRDYNKVLRNADKNDDRQLIALFKLLSPEHLLKLPFANDSNSLDKKFYSELLHLIGLTQTEQKGKKLIERLPEGRRESGSLLENAITQIESTGTSRHLNRRQYGETYDEQTFNIALELVITWINRILFLKLLEAQLLRYHNQEDDFAFLHIKRIRDYDQLNKLFFQVLAKKPEERSEDVKMAFEKVPYLNSSLFDPTDLEYEACFVSQLEDGRLMPVAANTVLKDEQGKKRSGQLNALEYFFEFLNAYDFSSEGSEDIQEDNKSLINASVLGLIFEKINGYKDGSFFTPGFITMYMCRETIRRAVVQKFNEAKGWNCVDLVQLYNQLDSNEYQSDNAIFNSIRICDPAVGSGHFLVSALNELITVKHELGLLRDAEGRKLRDYRIEIDNDELSITDEEGRFFEYRPHSHESQRVQKTLFHEKQAIIENCLFGVDINPNSVKICRLRLWIELLKNAYYVSASTHSSSPEQGRWPQAGGVNNLPHLKTFRKQLRNNLTPAEAKLWSLLKGKQLDGRKFRRQHSFANYILDFYCPEERLAIELDGQGHFDASQADYDYERDLFLKEFGIRVLRFENKWVWDNPEGLLEQVREWFGKQPKPPRPSDTNSPAYHNHFPGPPDTPPFKGGEPQPKPQPDSEPVQRGQSAPGQLETLPNIDINIKCGNSIVSRFPLDANLKKALHKSKYNIHSYRAAVQTYREARSKEVKHNMEQLIHEIKSDFRTEIGENDPKQRRLDKLGAELFEKYQSQHLFDQTLTAKQKAERKKLEQKINSLGAEIEEIKSNRMYDNAFEWRFEFPEVLNDNGDFEGFDVVIGNPPYFGLSKLKDYGTYFSENYQTYSKGSDIYCLFYERGGSILRKNGFLTYITSNSWLRAIYGDLLKTYFRTSLAPISLLNIEDVQVFEEATVESNILTLQKKQALKAFPVANLGKDYILGSYLGVYFKKNKFSFTIPETSEWFIGDQLAGDLKTKIEANSKLLRDYSVNINRGFLTGYNKAFIIEEETRNELLEADPKNATIIKPILRGRDLKKYSFQFSEFWMICTFPSLQLDIEDYPTIKDHFLRIGKSRLEQTGEKGSRKKTSNKWFETQDSIGYWKDFEKPKIVWGEISDKPKFAFDDKGYYAEATTFLMTGEKLKFLLGILNSKVSEWYFNLIGTTTGMGTNRWKKYKIELLPIREPSVEQEKEITELVDRIIDTKLGNPDADTKELEDEIDGLVYKLYGLEEEEIELIQKQKL